APDVPGQGRAGPGRVLHAGVKSRETDRGVIALEIHVVQDVLAAVGGVELEVAHGEDIPLGPVHAAARGTLQVEPVGQCQLEEIGAVVDGGEHGGPVHQRLDVPAVDRRFDPQLHRQQHFDDVAPLPFTAQAHVGSGGGGRVHRGAVDLNLCTPVGGPRRDAQQD